MEKNKSVDLFCLKRILNQNYFLLIVNVEYINIMYD